MIHNDIVNLIDKYCMGIRPTDAQLDEIFDKVAKLEADPLEVADYMEKMQNGPTREQREAKLKAEREAKLKAEREAKLKAEREARLKAEREAKLKAEREARLKAEREAELEAEREAEAKKRLFGFFKKPRFIFIVVVLILGSCWYTCNRNDDDSYYDEEKTLDTENDPDELAIEMAGESSKTADNESLSIEEKLQNRYDYVAYYSSDTFFFVKKNDKIGLCNGKGVEVVPTIYDDIYSISDGKIKVTKDNKQGYLDAKTFKAIIPCEYDYIYSKSGGTIKVEKGDKKGLIDANTYEVLVPCEYTYFYSESDGLIKVEKGDKIGFLNAKTYKLVTPCIYDYVYSPSGGLIKVEIGNKTGYLNMDGSVARSPQ